MQDDNPQQDGQLPVVDDGQDPATPPVVETPPQEDGGATGDTPAAPAPTEEAPAEGGDKPGGW